MTIVNQFARLAERVSYHVLESGDTAEDLQDWFGLLYPDAGPGGPDGWFKDNGDGTIGVFNTDTLGYVTASFGDYILPPQIFVKSSAGFAALYFPDPS